MPDFSAEQLAKEATQSTDIKRMSVKEYFQLEGFVKVDPKVWRSATSGYLFLNFYRSAEDKVTLSFSVAAQTANEEGIAFVEEGMEADREFLAKFDFGYVTNAKGEIKPMLVRKQITSGFETGRTAEDLF